MPEKEFWADSNRHPKYSAEVHRAGAKYLRLQELADRREKKFAGGAPIGFDTATGIRRRAEKNLKKFLPGSTPRLRDAVVSEAKRRRGDFKKPLSEKYGPHYPNRYEVDQESSKGLSRMKRDKNPTSRYPSK